MRTHFFYIKGRNLDMTDKEIKDILLSNVDAEKIIRENPGISRDDIRRVIAKIVGEFPGLFA